MKRVLSSVLLGVFVFSFPSHAALLFDGVDDRVKGTRKVQYSSGDFTIEGWLKTTQSSVGRIIAQPLGGLQSFSLLINVQVGKVEVRFDASDSSGPVVAVSESVVTDGNWHHVAGVFNASARRLMILVDGALETSIATSKTPLQSDQVPNIGFFDATVGQYYEGELDEVRYWSRALSVSELSERRFQRYTVQDIDPLTNPAQFGLVMPWSPNRGQEHPDLVLNNNPSVASSPSLRLFKDQLREVGISLNGSEYVEVPHIVDHVSASFTVEAWVFLNGSSDVTRRIITKPADDAGLQRYSLLANVVPGTVEFRLDPLVNINGTFLARSQRRIDDEKWHHVAGVFDSPNKRVRLFVDGVLEAETAIVGGPLDSIQPLQIGRFDSQVSQGMFGTLDEIRLWRVARTRAEIHDAYLRPLRGDESGLVAYYPIEEIDLSNLSLQDHSALANHSSSGFFSSGINREFKLETPKDVAILGVEVFEKDSQIVNRGNQPWLVIDGRVDRGNALAPGNTTTPQMVAFDLGDSSAFVNRIRVAKNGSIDTGPFAHMNLEVLFSTGTGSLNNRSYAPVAGLTNGFNGRELIQAEGVGRGGVVREDHDFESNGFYSLTFYDVKATAIALKVSRDSGDSQPWSHYRPLEVQMYHESSGVPVKLETALALDGTNDYLEIPRFPVGSDQSVTIETWMKSSEGASLGRLVTRVTPGGGKQQFSLLLNPGGIPEIRVDTSDGPIVARGTESVTDGEWHHIAGVFSDQADRLSLFVDGALVNAVPINRGILSATGPITIGRFSGQYGQYFKGVIDEVRIWNVARSDSDIQISSSVLLTGSEPGLVAYLPLNDGSGDRAEDFSPSGNDATLFNLPIWTSSDRSDPLTPPNAYTIGQLLSLPAIERPSPITTVTGIGTATLVLKNLQGAPPSSVKPIKRGEAAGGGSLVWLGMPFPVQSARVLQNPPRLALQCVFSLPGFSDVEGKPMQEGIELLVDSAGKIEISGGIVSIPKTFQVKKLAVSDIQFEYLASEEAFGGGLLLGWGNPKPTDLCGGGTKGPTRYGGKFRVRGGKLQKITIGAKAIRRPLGTSGAFMDEVAVTVDGLDTDNYSLCGRVKVNVGCPLIRRKSPSGDLVFAFPASAEASGRVFLTTGRVEVEGGVKLIGFDSFSGGLVYDPPYAVSGHAGVNFLLGVYVAETTYRADSGGFSGSATGTFTLPQDLGVFNRQGLTRLAADGKGTVLPDVQATIDGSGNLVGSFQLSKSFSEQNCSRSCSDICENSVVSWFAKVIKVNCRSVCDTTCDTVSKVLSAKVAFTIGETVGFEVKRKGRSSIGFDSDPFYPQYFDEASGTTLTLFTNWDPISPVNTGGELQRLFEVSTENQAETRFLVPDGSPAVIIQVNYENGDAEDVDVQLTLPDGSVLHVSEGALPNGFLGGQGFSTVNPDVKSAAFYLFEPIVGEHLVSVGNGEALGRYTVVAAAQDPEPYVEVFGLLFDEEEPNLFAVEFATGDFDASPENRFFLTENPELRHGTEIFPLEIVQEDDATIAVFDLAGLEMAPGDYHVMVTADDGRNARVEAFSELSVYIEDPRAPAPVTVLKTRSQKGGFTVAWDPNESDDAEHYTVLYTKDDDISGIQSAEVTGNEGQSKTVLGLENGTPYLVTVLAVNEGQFHSEIAAVHRVIPTEGVGLNPPVIVSNPYEFATAGFPYVYVPRVFDADAIIPAASDATMAPTEGGFRTIEVNDRWSLIDSPTGMTIDGDTGLVRWEPRVDQVGLFPVRIRVEEPDLSALGILSVPRSSMQSFELRVLPNDNLNGLEEHPFEFFSQPVLNVEVGETYRYPVSILGAPTGTYLLEVLDGPEEMQLTADNVLIWEVPEGAESTPVWLKASIPVGELLFEIDQEFILHVTHDDNRLPPLFEMTSVVQDHDDILIRWTGASAAYQIESTENLLSPVWEKVSEVIPAQSINSWRQAKAADRYFRVLEVSAP